MNNCDIPVRMRFFLFLKNALQVLTDNETGLVLTQNPK